jgi:hypothetical protein
MVDGGVRGNGEERGAMVRSRNREFRVLIQYKQAQAMVRSTVHQAKCSCFCRSCYHWKGDTCGEKSGISFKRMSGIRREWDYPVLTTGDGMAVTDEKAEMMAKASVQVHSSANWSEGAERTR